MAEVAVGLVLNQIGTLLLQEGKLLSGIGSKIEGIKDDLKIMQAFLRDADSREENDAGVKTWVEQMRAVAYDTEDALDEFILLAAKQPRPRNPFIRFLCKTACFIKYWKENHQIANEIHSIKKRVHGIKEGSQTFQFRLDHQASSSTYRPDPQGDDALFTGESKVVGIKERRDQMLKLLLNGDPNLKVVSVVGMAGLGKTTLVKNVYDYLGMRESFQFHAWITVSQSSQIEQVLRDMLMQLFGLTPQIVDSLNRAQFTEMIKRRLRQKRYVIVFDDLWSTDAWAYLERALPDDKNSSRIMITTRIADVASYSSGSVEDIYQLQPLDWKDAWDLFCRKAFRSDRTCPSGLQPLSEKILSNCGGLPLAIVVIASLLSTKDDKIEEWQSVLLRTQIESNAKLNNMMKIIMLSYDDLPYYLKSCLLYLSIFPEDYQFRRTKVVRLWVAEGFIEDKHIGNEIEYVAEGYFDELLNRSFIQVVNDYSFLDEMECQVHDLIHQMILQKSRDQTFATVLGEEEQSIPLASPKIRRLSMIHKSNGEEEQSIQLSWNEGKSFSHLRSLLLFDISSSSMPSISWDALQLLKVLDLEGAPLEVFPEEIVRLFHLRFLSLKSTKIKTIPPSIGMLSRLETLDLMDTYVSKLPATILKLKRLRHLLGKKLVLELPLDSLDSPPTFDCFQGSTLMPNGIGNLEALQTLGNVEANFDTNILARELKSLTQLESLGILGLRREDGIHLCSSIEKMANLRYLDIQAVQEEEIIDLRSLTSPSPLLQQIEIQGRLHNYPHWMPSLHNLERLYIKYSRLRTDPLEALQALPRLSVLYFHKAYHGEQLCFQAGGFQRLLCLVIDDLENLRSVRVEKGGIPLVQQIMIANCALLEKAPIGIEVLNNLKLLQIVMPHPKLGETLNPERGGQDRERLSNIPVIRVLCQTREYEESIMWTGKDCILKFDQL